MIKMIKLLEKPEEDDTDSSTDEDDWTEFDPHLLPLSDSTDDSQPSTSRSEETTQEQYSIVPVRCAAHTLQLAVKDALTSEANSQIIIMEARALIRRLRTPTITNILRSANKTKPLIDCATRWHSTIDMLQSLPNVKSCCSENRVHKLFMSSSSWEAITDIVKALEPAKILTKHLQEEELTFGDFYCYWLQCVIDTRKVNTPLAEHIVIAMERRQKELLEHNTFLAAAYLDARINVVLSPEETTSAKQHILDLSSHYKKINRIMTPDISDIAEVEAGVDSEDELNVLLRNTAKERDRPDQNAEPRNLEYRLNKFIEEPRLRRSENILKYWESKKFDYPELYNLAKIILAVPATQVSVERLFSSLKYVLSDLRYNLNDETVQDILLIRNNSDISN